jgi:hypothetical protein
MAKPLLEAKKVVLIKSIRSTSDRRLSSQLSKRRSYPSIRCNTSLKRMHWAQRKRVKANGHSSFLSVLCGFVAHSEQREGDSCGRGLHDTPCVRRQ